MKNVPEKLERTLASLADLRNAEVIEQPPRHWLAEEEAKRHG